MARRKAAYRRKNQNRLSMFLVSVVVVMILVVVAWGSKGLKEKNAAYEARIEALNAQIQAEETRSEEIEEFRKYTQTKQYAEEVAKEKLGMVHEGEIIFKEEDAR